jgi:nematocidal protein AidA
MSEFIDVLITIDAKAIVDKYGRNTHSNSLAGVDRSLIHLDAKQSQVVSAPGSIDLAVAARPGDTIRWRETTLSMNTEYTGILYGFTPQAGGDLISTPQPRNFTINEPLPNMRDPLNPTMQQVKTYVWQSDILDPARSPTPSVS